jgi:hypothetical protein
VGAGRSSELIRKACGSKKPQGFLNFNITIEKKSFCIARSFCKPAGLTLDRPYSSGHVQQEDCVMLLRFGFDQCCEIVGRVSAIIAIAGMASLVFAATAVDVLR